MAEDEIEYESDPEEAKLSLKMRRREASDDEEEEEQRLEEIREKPLRRIDDSDGESEGGAAEYEYGESEEEGGEDYDTDEDYVEEGEGAAYEQSAGAGGGDGVEIVAVGRDKLGKETAVSEELIEEKKVVSDPGEIYDENNNVVDGQHGEEKKEVEPFAVPTAGAFYMHDDRFRDNAGGRHRRTLGGRRLWESKDNMKWGHDKFEELTMQDRDHEERRRGPRGRYRGRGRINRSSDRGYARVSKSREYNNNTSQNNAPKIVRGRGPRRYQPSFNKNNNEASLPENKQSTKPNEKPSYASSVRTSEVISNSETGVPLAKKQTFASNLNIASPPFYPSGSSSKDNTVPPKRDLQPGMGNRNGQPSVVENSFNMVQSSATMQGKNIVDSMGMDKLYLDDSFSAVAGKPSNPLQMPLPRSASTSSTQPHLRGQGRGIMPPTQMAYQPAISNNQVNKVTPPNQLQAVQRNPSQGRVQSSVQTSGQQFNHVPSGTQTSPPKSAAGVNSFESGDLESLSESSKSRTALVPKSKGSMQGNGKGSFLYGGPQVMGASGNMGSGHGDQNFPTFLPVMQFGGQHPGGIGVPAVGMAFPGYVAQPQLAGLGNSEMTWLPVLAGAAGALGATYCPPYITRPSGQASSTVAASSKDSNAPKVSNDWQPVQKPELATDEFGQRQKNPRRYTEMKFDQ